MRRVIGRIVGWVGMLLVVPAWSSDWSQWRGPDRNGVAPTSPPLRRGLPAEGLEPIWISEKIPSGRDGGWGSPLIAGGKVYLFTHIRTKKSDSGEVPARKFPWLPEDRRGHLTPQQYEEYERNRRQEDFALGTGHYDFAEQGILWLEATPAGAVSSPGRRPFRRPRADGAGALFPEEAGAGPARRNGGGPRASDGPGSARDRAAWAVGVRLARRQ